MNKKDQDRIAARVTASIELRKHTDLAKNAALRQELSTPDYRENKAPFIYTDEQMMVLLVEKIGLLAGAVCGGDDRGQAMGALLKVASLSKIWLENMERDMRQL